MSRARWAIVLAVVVVLAAVAAAYAAGRAKAVPVQDVVRTKRFELVDAKGRVRVEIGMGGVNGRAATVRLSDEKGRTRAWLTAPSDGSVLLILTAGKGYGGAYLSVLPDGTPALGLDDETGMGRAALRFLPGGGPPELSLWDEKGQWRASLSLRAGGRPGLVLSDEKGQARAALGATSPELMKTGETRETAESSLVLFDKEGKVMWQAP